MINFFKKEPIIRFKSMNGAPEISPMTKIIKASEYKPQWLLNQKSFDNKDKFMNCPGMVDWMQAGYLLVAWTDIKIKANKSGIFIKMFNEYTTPPSPLNAKLVDGIAFVDSSVKFTATKVPTPWGIFTKKGYSAHVLPALYHCEYLEYIYFYAGTCDYDNFTTVNLMITPLKECEIEIPAGTPLLQIIPYKREEITAVCGSGTQKERDIYNFSFPTRVKAAYRKFFHQRKIYLMEYK